MASATAPILNFEICQESNCKDITFSEITGLYNSTYNLGGYESPNVSTSSVLTAILTIVSPSNIIYTINLFTQGFPTANINSSYLISLIPNISLDDGQWKFTYTITTSDNTYSKTIYKYLYCNSQCCVNQMLANIKISNCDCCDDLDSNNYLKASQMLDSLKKVAKCGDLTNFTNISKILNKLCKNINCKTCN